MNRITLSLENDFEGKVIASFDLEEYAEQIRADAIEEALAYCNQNNDEKEECWCCCLSVWKDGQFAGCYLEKLKEKKNE